MTHISGNTYVNDTLMDLTDFAEWCKRRGWDSTADKTLDLLASIRYQQEREREYAKQRENGG